MRTRRRAPRAAGRVPFWYSALVVISAIIVIAFIVYKTMVKPPEVQAAPPQEPAAPAQTGPASGENGETGAPTPIPLIRRDGAYTFLLFGVGLDGNTDTILVGRYDAKAQSISLVSVPRDSMIDTERPVKKINAAYAYGGTEGLLAALEDMLGIPLDFYLRVNMAGFVRLVDAVGGVSFDVPIDMDYEDPTQDLSIHISKGYQKLNGEQALKLVRFRSGYASQDIGRMETQQKFLKALAKQALSIGNVPKLAAVARDNLTTDLKLENIIWFGEQMLSLDLNDLQMQTLPNVNPDFHYHGGSYLLLDADGVLEAVNAFLNPYTTELTAEHLNVFDGE